MSIKKLPSVIDDINGEIGKNRLLRTLLEVYRIVDAPVSSGLKNKTFFKTTVFDLEQQESDIYVTQPSYIKKLRIPQGSMRQFDGIELAAYDIYDKLQTCQEQFSMFMMFVDVKWESGKRVDEFESVHSHANLLMFEKNPFGCNFTLKRYDSGSDTTEDQDTMDKYVILLLIELRSLYDNKNTKMPRLVFIQSKEWCVLKVQANFKSCFVYCIAAYKKLLKRGRGVINKEYTQRIKDKTILIQNKKKKVIPIL